MSDAREPGDELPDDPGADDVAIRAGEYVLGVLDAAEAGRVRLAAMTDLDLADAIIRWEVRLAPLVDLAPAAAPPPDLWRRIDASLDAPRAPAAVTALPSRAKPASGTAVWRAATAVALAAAAAFAAVAFIPRAPAPSQVAALVPMNGQAPAFVAQVRPDGTVLLTAVAPGAVPTNRDLELWLLAAAGEKPVSLGVLPVSGRTITLARPLPDGAQLLVSLEPQGGSPTGQPTGPVLYGGALRRS